MTPLVAAISILVLFVIVPLVVYLIDQWAKMRKQERDNLMMRYIQVGGYRLEPGDIKNTVWVSMNRTHGKEIKVDDLEAAIQAVYAAAPNLP